MSIKLNSSGGGSVSIQEPVTSGTFTLTAPARTGNIITSADTGTITQGMMASGVAGNGPAFSAYASSATNTATASWTKIVFAGEEFDTNNCYNDVNSRFTPTIAGYYSICGCVFAGSVPATMGIAIYKNGSEYRTGVLGSGASLYRANVAGIVYLNGTTDYVELYWYQASGVTVNSSTGSGTYFQGALVRAA